jgi:UPF0755 protein
MAKKKSGAGKAAGKGKGMFRKVLISFLLICFVGAASSVYYLYTSIYSPNIKLDDRKSIFFYVPTGSDFESVINSLDEKGIIKNINTFKWLAQLKKYDQNIRPGRYRILNNMNNNALINLLRAGIQEPIKLTFSHARDKEKLAGILARQIEADSISIIRYLNNSEFLKQYSLRPNTALCLFIPNTYEVYWNTSAEQLLKRMGDEYQRFWTEERLNKARNLNLSRAQVSILASIVQQESNVSDERPVIAGVYLNRLRKGMLLQADPTVVFAVGDFTIKRVLTVHTQYDSPYNTYKYTGLPPGPICMPTINAIDAVLNARQHSYIYFCAKEDFSGRHNFATTLQEHERNAAKFRQALNKRKIYR